VRVQRVLAGIVLLGLSIVIPASFSAPVFVYVLWAIVGVAAGLWVVLSAPITERIPWRVMRKDEATDRIIGRAVQLYILRNDVQKAFTNLNQNLKNPTPSELRAFADNLARRLRDDGYDVTAKKVEVHLPDNADRAAIHGRRSSLFDQIMRLLIWDEYE
jgi:hypothetical protein